MSRNHHHNHFVPQMLLRHWLVEQDGFRGVHVHVVKEGVSRFERVGKRARKPYRFAAVPDLYVPVVEGERATSLEAGWLQGQERLLASVIGQAERRGRMTFQRARDVTVFKMALFCLEHRSPSEIHRLEAFLESHPDLRERVTANPERSTRQIVLENLIHIVTEMANRHPFLRVTFLHSTGPTFVIGDRPYFRADDDGGFVVLTRKLAVNYLPSPDHQDEFNHRDIPPALVDHFNGLVARQAREWLVADSPERLQEYASVFSTDEWKRAWEESRIDMLRPLALSTGWSITR